MGGLLSYLFSVGTPSYDRTPDSATGLSEFDRHIISETWAMISDKDSIKQNGMDFFLLLFKTHPYLQDFFADFKNKSPSELVEMSTMKSHSLTVMYSVGTLVENMDDPSSMVGLIEKLAVSHKPRGITHTEFDKLSKVFVAFVKIGLGEKCTPEVASAWTKLLAAMTAVVKKAQADPAKQ